MVTRAGLCLWLLVAACAGRPAAGAPAPAGQTAASGGAPSVAVQPATPASSAAPADAGAACGALACKAFPSAAAAFDHVLAEAPRVLAIGEAHAQRTGPQAQAPSTTRRFMDQLLPRLAPRAADLVIELPLPNGSCAKVEQQVRKQQEPVTAPQAATNQNEFVELGHRAKALAIQPHALVPSCEQLQKIAEAGDNDIFEMLRMIRDVTQHDVSELLSRRAPDRLIVAYGGAVHNDLVPLEGNQDFSFGPELAKLTGDRYVELDLVIPEQIRDSETWRARPWYPHYSREKAGNYAYLYSWAPRAYVLFFPKDSGP